VNGGFCVDCGHRVESFDGLKACPACNSPSVPCADERQVNININWHELRILCIWAENYQRARQLGKTVYAIARRLTAQHPAMAKASPLTLAEEIGQLVEHFDGVQVSDPDLRRDVAEQTGQEPGLILPPPVEP
jgi:hypothetical protein